MGRVSRPAALLLAPLLLGQLAGAAAPGFAGSNSAPRVLAPTSGRPQAPITASSAASISASAAVGRQVTSPEGAQAQRFGRVGEFSFTERSGRTVTREDLVGRPWVATLFFTTCSGPCPALMGNISARLAQPLAELGVPIVSFTVDPETDDPERLTAYADNLGADPEGWLFLTGPELELHAFVQRELKLAVAPAPEAHEVPADAADRLDQRLEATHATKLVAIDAEGAIAGYYECGGEAGLSPEEVDASFARLRSRLEHLVRAGREGSNERALGLPLVNASLNGLAALLLILGLRAIRSGRRERHAFLMRGAFLVSAAFLACYLYYHAVVLPASGGPTRYNGSGFLKVAYLLLLASHVILAAVNLPMVLMTLWLAHKESWERHKRWARWTYPLWLYVSVTGVLVYLVLYHGNPPPTT